MVKERLPKDCCLWFQPLFLGYITLFTGSLNTPLDALEPREIRVLLPPDAQELEEITLVPCSQYGPLDWYIHKGVISSEAQTRPMKTPLYIAFTLDILWMKKGNTHTGNVFLQSSSPVVL